jgi:hypothetical protein
MISVSDRITIARILTITKTAMTQRNGGLHLWVFPGGGIATENARLRHDVGLRRNRAMNGELGWLEGL